jgi:RNA polymerase sigma factor (sigma-70 family)
LFRARGCSPEEAADLAQEAAVRAFLHIRRWGASGEGLDPLLNRIARNLLIDRYRRTTPHLVPLDSAGDIHDPAQDPTEEVARRQRRRAVHHAIRELPSRHQRAITYSLSGMTPEEVGRQLGIGRNAADALLHRARRTLRQHLAPVRDGMWGLALAMRIRYDRFMRRAGLDTATAEASGSLITGSAVGLATAAMVVATALGGGGGSGAASVPTRSGSLMVRSAPSGATSLPSNTGGNVLSPGTAGGSGSGNTFRFGPTTTTYGPHDFSNRVDVPDPSDKNGPPWFGIEQDICTTDCPAPSTSQQPDMATTMVCRTSAVLCSVWEGPGA